MAQTKQCSGCGEVKLVSEFSKKLRGLYGVGGKCKSCKALITAGWRKSNPERNKAAVNKWHKEHPDRVKENHKKWKNAHPGRSYELNKKSEAADPERKAARDARYRRTHIEQERIRIKKWAKANPERMRITCRNRRARIRRVSGNGWSAEEEKQLIVDYDHRCAYCGKKTKPEMDHIIPLMGGGEHSIENIVPACKSCNSGKQDRPLLLWMYREMAIEKTANCLGR